MNPGHTDFHLPLGSNEIESYLKRLTKLKKVSLLSTNGEENEKDIIFVGGKKQAKRATGTVFEVQSDLFTTLTLRTTKLWILLVNRLSLFGGHL